MRIVIAAVGRLKDGPERELFAKYIERLDGAGRPLGLGPVKTVELAESRAQHAAGRQSDEAERLLRAVEQCDARVALDGGGKAMTSELFALWLRGRRDSGTRSLGMMIGGPDGHGSEAVSGAELVLSLGGLTLPHGLARIILAEQLYRAATILAGHPYHRG